MPFFHYFLSIAPAGHASLANGMATHAVAPAIPTHKPLSLQLAFFGLSGTELLIIVVVALLVIGPKDLPPLVRGIMAMWRKLQLMVHEFQQSFQDMADEMDMKRHAEELKQKIMAETDQLKEKTGFKEAASLEKNIEKNIEKNMMEEAEIIKKDTSRQTLPPPTQAKGADSNHINPMIDKPKGYKKLAPPTGKRTTTKNKSTKATSQKITTATMTQKNSKGDKIKTKGGRSVTE